MHPLRNGLANNLIALALMLMLIVLWLLVHGYQGFAGDAQIYAFQALSRIHPAFLTDLYLQNTSQDQFTIFSPLYAWFIQRLGLNPAALGLTLLFSIWLMTAAWNLAASLTERGTAWLAVAFLIIAAGDYGAAGVFRIFEPYLTARLPAQAMIITALVCHVRGARVAAFALAIAALLVHPLMALPGLLLLICLSLPWRLTLLCALGGIVATLGITMSAAALPWVAQRLPLMDADWLDVVRERSQFLFLDLWSLRDWDINSRPLLILLLIAVVLDQPRARKMCIAGVLVGACGLAVAWLASAIGPVAVLVQGQAWRWVWPAIFLSILLLPGALLRVWRHQQCGPLCAMLLIGGWVLSGFGATACVWAALLLWLARDRVTGRIAAPLRWIAAGAATVLLVWAARDIALHASFTLAGIAQVPGVTLCAAGIFALLWGWLRHGSSSRLLWGAVAVLLIACTFIAPASFRQARALGSASDMEEFAPWSSAIPATSTVLVAPAHDVGSFVWFTLSRPNYLALDQSSGVVFSRETALEILRRSELLLPLTDPTWKILSKLRGGGKPSAATRPLTAEILKQICSDPKLGFVISPQNVGFEPLRHDHAGPWKNWNLYDCGRVRGADRNT